MSLELTDNTEDGDGEVRFGDGTRTLLIGDWANWAHGHAARALASPYTIKRGIWRICNMAYMARARGALGMRSEKPRVGVNNKHTHVTLSHVHVHDMCG